MCCVAGLLMADSALQSGEAMSLECQCRGELALRHRSCAEKWSRVKVCLRPIYHADDLVMMSTLACLSWGAPLQVPDPQCSVQHLADRTLYSCRETGYVMSAKRLSIIYQMYRRRLRQTQVQMLETPCLMMWTSATTLMACMGPLLWTRCRAQQTLCLTASG